MPIGKFPLETERGGWKPGTTEAADRQAIYCDGRIGTGRTIAGKYQKTSRLERVKKFGFSRLALRPL